MNLTKSHYMSNPYPLGAHLKQHEKSGKYGCNFSIHAPDCKQIKLVLFDEGEPTQITMTDKYMGIYHIFIDNIKVGQAYNYLTTVDGEEWLLIDPYAKAISKSPQYTPPYTSAQSWQLCHAFVCNDDFDWQQTQQPKIPLEETILLETHIKGFSQNNLSIPDSERGNYQALSAPENIERFKQQGVTSVQLLPVAACISEPHLLSQNGQNYWGYNPLVFMAPDPRFAIKDAVSELKTTVRELHRNNIEVILDVVYNHTAEGNDQGPNFNLKLLDTQYYQHDKGEFKNYTGCGNTLNLTHQASLNLVLDSLRHWVTEYKIDGFRFDLAASLGRQGSRFCPQASFFQAIAQDPILREVKLIAEPWDIGPNGYQLGSFPDGWNECNDKFRNTVRSFWRGESSCIKDLATHFMGSRPLFSASRWPHKLSVNYITYHDGFTLQDLVSYNQKNNHHNGEDNRDGSDDNRSFNCGIEGQTSNPAIIALREKQKRNLMATMLFSFGIPHILAADLLSHSQQGNNNAYCQDNNLSWLNWDINKSAQQFQLWLAAMTKARKQYLLPFIHAFSLQQQSNHKIAWYTPQGEVMQRQEWEQCQQVILHMSLANAARELLVIFNQAEHEVRVALPQGLKSWQLICDSQYFSLPVNPISEHYMVSARSIVILRKGPIALD